MKKLLLLAAAFIATSTAFAQENLALGGTATATSGDAQLAIDDNEGTRWEAPASAFSKSEEMEWLLDFGEAKTFNTIQIKWEGAYSKSFVISVSEDGKSYTDVVTVNDVMLSELLQTYSFDEVTARYVKFNNVARATQWGVSFFEFRVFKMADATLSAITLSSSETVVKVGTPVSLTVIGKDQIGKPMDAGEVTFEVTPSDAGTIANGVFTPLKAGEAKILAKSGDITSNEITVTAYSGEKIDLFTNMSSMVTPLGEGTTTESMVGAFDANMGSVWEMYKSTAADEAARTYETGFVIDLQATYDITAVSMMFEGACPADYTVSFAGNAGVYSDAHVVKDHAGMATFTDFFLSEAKDVRYIKFLSTKAATQYGVKMFDFSVYGENKKELEDNAAPTEFTASVVEEAATMASVTLKLKATDDVSSVISYEISYNKEGGEAQIAITSGASGEETTYVLDGLEANTTYNISVVAKDGKGNAAEAISLVATTKAMPAAAPAPIVDASNVKSVYSDKYGNAEGFMLPDWGQATVTTEIELAEGDKSLLLSNMNYRGLQFTKMDVSDMEYLHVDVYPETANSVIVTPIWSKEPDGNYAEIAYTINDLKAGEWNSVNIPLGAYASDDREGTNVVYQIKLDGGNGNTFIFDNIYFAKTGIVDTEAPTELTATATTVKAKSAILTVKANDNNENGLLTYTVKNGEETIAVKEKVAVNAEAEIELSNLTPETKYTLTVIVADGSDNTAETTVEFTTPVNITVTENERGVWVIEGDASVESIEKELADETKTAFDLRGLVLPENVTSLNVGNPNALIVVTDEQAAQLTEMKNLFYIQANTWFIARAQYEITDGYSVYTNFYISTGDKGYKYTRDIAAGKYVTTTLPKAITLPEGVSAYEFDAQNENVYTFKRIENKQLAAHTPYILYSAEGVTLEVTGTGDLDMADGKGHDTGKINNLTCGNLTFHGNYDTFAGDGTQYGLLNSTESIVLNKVDGGTIGAFRGYFTVNGDESAAKNIRFIFNNGGTDGISSVNGETTAKAGNVYTINGRFVNSNGSVVGLAKGLYIVGGKKVVVK